MRIRRKFLQLTKYTYPYGTEGFLKGFLPRGYQTDDYGNHFLVVGDTLPTTMFTCHLDTACSKQDMVKHVFKGNMIGTNGKTILGADDKAGMVVILYMIEKKIPGLYYFFLGEEVGCIGSGDLADNWKDCEFSKTITKVISFDRRGTSSIITHQYMGRCCSDEFGKILAGRLNVTNEKLRLDIDDTGIMTDSAKFVDLVPECTNVSVGYYREHTHSECQNIEYLQILCQAVVEVDWETLPIVRDPKKENIFKEENYSWFKSGEKVVKMYISKDHIFKERSYIWDWIINNSGHDTKGFTWNGNVLHLETEVGKYEFLCNREYLMDFIPELCTVPKKELSLELPEEIDPEEDEEFTKSINSFEYRPGEDEFIRKSDLEKLFL